MHIAFALFADAANLSQEGKLNILGVFDAVQVGGLPTVHPRATVVVHLKGTAEDAGRHSVLLRWVNPRGQELWSSVGSLEIATPPDPSAEMDVPLIASVDLPIDAVGPFTLGVSVDDQVHAELRLQVRMGSVQQGVPGMPAMPTGGLVS